MFRKTIVPAATVLSLLTVAASPAFALEPGEAALGLTSIAVGAAAAVCIIIAIYRCPTSAVHSVVKRSP